MTEATFGFGIILIVAPSLFPGSTINIFRKLSLSWRKINFLSKNVWFYWVWQNYLFFYEHFNTITQVVCVYRKLPDLTGFIIVFICDLFVELENLRADQITVCFEPWQKPRARLQGHNRFKPPSILIPTVPRRYFCCGSLLLLVLVVGIYTLVHLLC